MSRSFSWVRRHVDPIGIDLGTRCVRMLQLARHRGQVAAIACKQVALPPGPHNPAEQERLQAQAVTELLRQGDFVGRDVVTALGWDDLQARNLRLPVMPGEEVGEVVRFESAERFGLDPGAAEVRFLVAGDVRQGTEIRQEVIVLVADRSKVEARINMLAKMGLRPVAVDAGPCAIFRGFERFLRRDQDTNEVNAFVDLGYSGTRVVISRGEDLIFFKTIPVGGRRFDELVSDQLDFRLDEAAEIRVRLHRQHVAAMTGQTATLGPDETVGENVQRAVLDALRPALEQLSKEIGLCLRYCSVTFRGLRSEAVTVVGGEACNNDILRLLADQVNVPFRIGQPMRNIGCELSHNGADRRTGQPDWATAVGLALKPVAAAAEVA